ncbi:hypothetical protein [Streptomyces sp. NPDC055055]
MAEYHAPDGRILAVILPADLDIAARGSVVLHVEALELAYRPRGVRLPMPSRPATGASLSVIARARRLREYLSIAVTHTGRPWAEHAPPARADRPEVGWLLNGSGASP